MFRFSALLFVALALFSSQLAFAAPCNCKHKHKGSPGFESSPPPSTSTPSYVSPTPVVNTDPPTTTVTSSTYNPYGSGVPGGDQLLQQTTTSSPSPTPTPTSTSSTPTSTPTGGVSADDISTYLSAHNTVRAQHGASPLTWSDDLSNVAQGWANNCIFEHSNGTLGAFGENLAAGTGDYTIDEAVGDWAAEASQYDPNTQVPSHFTQMVWKSTTQVGCAVATCNGIFPSSYGPAQFYVCEYNPEGNILGEFSENVQA